MPCSGIYQANNPQFHILGIEGIPFLEVSRFKDPVAAFNAGAI
jgi:hypothetical protein